MYDFLIGLTFDEAIEELEAQGIHYTFEYSDSVEDAREEGDLVVGDVWGDCFYFYFEDGVIDEYYGVEQIY